MSRYFSEFVTRRNMAVMRSVEPKATVTITTLSRDGASHTFEVEREAGNGFHGTDWIYTIRSTTKPGHFFQARFKAIPGDRIRPAAIDHYGIDEFVAKGIPEELFEDVVRVSGRRLVSSLSPIAQAPRAAPGDLDFDTVDERSPQAKKVWKRLEYARRATYDADEDRFLFVPRK